MQIGPYSVLGEIARGGMGVVYQAHDTRLDRTVVLKWLKVDHERGRARLLREAKAMARLVHPHVVPLLDVGEHAGQPYLVLPWVKGESLQARLDREGQRPVAEAIRLTQQIGSGLQAVHALGLLHRDVKPDNVLLDGQGNALLTDFGLVKAKGPGVEQTVSLSVKGRSLGTPGYWPREQAFGKLELIGPLSDVYALGATLYAMLSGRPPRATGTLQETLSAFDAPPIPLRTLRPEAPEWLEALLAACLDNDPTQRPGLEAVLARLKEGGSRETRPAVAQARSGRRGWWVGLGAVALVAAAGLAWSVWPGEDSPASPEPEATPGLPTAPPGDVVSPPEPSFSEPSRADEAKRWVEEGDRKFKLGRYADAIEDYDRAQQLDPNDAIAYRNRGVSKAQLERFAEAIEDFDRALALDPNHALTYANRGASKDELRRFAEAIEDYDKALALDPSDALTYANRGLSKSNLKRFAEAIEDYDRALALDPNDALTYTNRGVSKGNLGRHAEAIEDCDRALALDSNNALTYTNRGACKSNLKRFAEAIEDYDRALALDPNSADAYVNRGLSKANLKRFAEAIEDFDRALALGLDANTTAQVRTMRERAAAELKRD